MMLPPSAVEGGREELGEPDAVLVLDVREDRHVLELEVLGRELGHHRALEGIDEAHAEDVVADLGHLRVGRRGRDHRHARPTGRSGRRPCSRLEATSPITAITLVLIDQLLHHRRRFLRLALVVLDSPPARSARRSCPASGPCSSSIAMLDATLGRLAEVGVAAGQRAVLADDELFLAGGTAASDRDDGQQGEARERKAQTGAGPSCPSPSQSSRPGPVRSHRSSTAPLRDVRPARLMGIEPELVARVRVDRGKANDVWRRILPLHRADRVLTCAVMSWVARRARKRSRMAADPRRRAPLY